jgi:predicted ArsR family transcriptional regulator
MEERGMSQLSLLEAPARARKSDPATSHEAAARVREFGQAHQALILQALKRFGKAGAEQIAAATRLDAYRVRKRLAELHDDGLAHPTGETRKTASGRSERVWEAA